MSMSSQDSLQNVAIAVLVVVVIIMICAIATLFVGTTQLSEGWVDVVPFRRREETPDDSLRRFPDRNRPIPPGYGIVIDGSRPEREERAARQALDRLNAEEGDGTK